MNTNQNQTAPLNNAQIAMNITNGALLVAGNAMVVGGMVYALNRVQASTPAFCTVLVMYNLIVRANLNNLIKKFFN